MERIIVDKSSIYALIYYTYICLQQATTSTSIQVIGLTKSYQQDTIEYIQCQILIPADSWREEVSALLVDQR